MSLGYEIVIAIDSYSGCLFSRAMSGNSASYDFAQTRQKNVMLIDGIFYNVLN